jgi:hypothetical protein
MSDSKRISYSAWSKFWTCPALYDFQYNHRLSPIKTSSSLVFGTAIDRALDSLYSSGAKQDPVEVFRTHFEWDNMADVEFDKKDLDESVLSSSDLESLNGKGFEYTAWACLRVKGRALVEAYIEQIYPLIKNIHGTQYATQSRPGFIDLLADVTLVSDERVIIDHKTSNWPYTEESATYGAQLIFYASDLGVNTVAYCVLPKNFRGRKNKRCPKCSFEQVGGGHRTCNNIINDERCGGEWEYSVSMSPEIQFIFGKPSKRDKDAIEMSLNETDKMIKQCGKTGFPKNMSTCDWIYGKRCQYFNYCRNGDQTGLVYRPKRETK